MQYAPTTGRLDRVETLADPLRREPYRLLTNDCITKSVRLKRLCRAEGISVKVVVCIGLARAKWFGRWLTIPVVHGWVEVDRKRIETSRPLGASGLWGIVPAMIRPVVCLRF